MVKIAIAGGSGQVAREVTDVLLATGKHDITVLTRNTASKLLPGARQRVVDYSDRVDLVDALRGTHTVLSFVQLLSDPDNQSQKNLIDAAIVAGVQRFAPSEYGSAGTTDMPWWFGKEDIRVYLRKVNEKTKVLEYTLFQPGLFLDYLATPYKTAKYIDPLQSVFNLERCRAFVVDGHADAVLTLTTAADLAAVIARAVDYDGMWPEIGGIRGNRVTVSEVIEIGERVRGRPFAIDKVKIKDLEAGTLDTPWALEKRHQAVSEEDHGSFVKKATIGILLSIAKGAWDVSDNLSKLFPDYEFEGVEHFLQRVWSGKP